LAGRDFHPLDRGFVGCSSSLPSIPSAAWALFGDFSGTMELCDFPGSSIIGLCPWTSRCGLSVPLCRGGPGISRFPCEMFPCVLRGLRPRRERMHLALATHPLLPSAHHYGVGSLYFERFHGSIPGPLVPLSTLRPGLYRPLRMTRGRCGSLRLHRMTLSFTTPRRFIPAHRSSTT
jgi:hypothetical protein